MRVLRNLRMIWIDVRLAMMANRIDRLEVRHARVSARKSALKRFYNAMDKAWEADD